MASPTCRFSAPDGRVYNLSSWANTTVVATGAGPHASHYNLSLCGNLNTICHDSLTGTPMPAGIIFSMYDGEKAGTCWDVLAHWSDRLWQKPTFHANGLTLHFSHAFDAHLGCIDHNVTTAINVSCNPKAQAPIARGEQRSTSGCVWQFAVETSHPTICKPGSWDEDDDNQIEY